MKFRILVIGFKRRLDAARQFTREITIKMLKTVNKFIFNI